MVVAGVFFLCSWIVYGILVFGEEERSEAAIEQGDGYGARDQIASEPLKQPVA
jgi:hypothetical protein